MNTGLCLPGQKVKAEYPIAPAHIVCVCVGGGGWGCSFEVVFGSQIFPAIKGNSMPHHLVTLFWIRCVKHT